MRYSDAVYLFLSVREAEGLSPRTLRWYADQLTALERHLGADRPVGAVSAAEVAAFLASESRRGLSASTLDARYRAIQALYNWLELSNGTPSPLGTGRRKILRRPKVPAPVIRYVTVEEYERVVHACDPSTWTGMRDRAILATLFWSGLRLAECAALHTVDVDLSKRLLTVRCGKGGKGRIVPCHPDLGASLAGYLMCRPPFVGDELWLADGLDHRSVRGALSREGIRQMLKRRSRQAGMRRLNPHAFRHGFAMWSLNGGADMSAVSQMLGHSSEVITGKVYAKWLVDGIVREYKEAVARTADGTRND